MNDSCLNWTQTWNLKPKQRVGKTLSVPKSLDKQCGVCIHFESIEGAEIDASKLTIQVSILIPLDDLIKTSYHIFHKVTICENFAKLRRSYLKIRADIGKQDADDWSVTQSPQSQWTKNFKGKVFWSKVQAHVENVGLYMAFWYCFSFASVLAANCSCYWFKFKQEIRDIYQVIEIWNMLILFGCLDLLNELSKEWAKHFIWIKQLLILPKNKVLRLAALFF